MLLIMGEKDHKRVANYKAQNGSPTAALTPKQRRRVEKKAKQYTARMAKNNADNV
jgi:hypothetical protein